MMARFRTTCSVFNDGVGSGGRCDTSLMPGVVLSLTRRVKKSPGRRPQPANRRALGRRRASLTYASGKVRPVVLNADHTAAVAPVTQVFAASRGQEVVVELTWNTVHAGQYPTGPP